MWCVCSAASLTALGVLRPWLSCEHEDAFSFLPQLLLPGHVADIKHNVTHHGLPSGPDLLSPGSSPAPRHRQLRVPQLLSLSFRESLQL